KPPEAWRYGNSVQQQMWHAYWDKHPNGPANRTDPASVADSHMPSMATPDDIARVAPSPPRMPGALDRRPDVVQLKHDRDEAYGNLQTAVTVRDDQGMKMLYDRIVALDKKLNDLIRQSFAR